MMILLIVLGYLMIAVMLAIAVNTVLATAGRRQFGIHIYLLIGLFWPISIPYIISRILFLQNGGDDP